MRMTSTATAFVALTSMLGSAISFSFSIGSDSFELVLRILETFLTTLFLTFLMALAALFLMPLP